MTVPVQVTFRNMTAIEDVRKEIETRVQKLETYCKPILNCQVTIEAPAKHHRKGAPFQVRIDATLSDGRIDVKYAESSYPAGMRKNQDTSSEHNLLMFTIREAFSAGRRQLHDHALKRRAGVKTSEPDIIATISDIFPEKGYGYLETPEGRQIYFHENSIVGTRFEKIKLGAQVHFVEEPGLKGPQASAVRVLRKPRTIHGALSK